LRSFVAKYRQRGPGRTIASGMNASPEDANAGDSIAVGPADPACGEPGEDVSLCGGSTALLQVRGWSAEGYFFSLRRGRRGCGKEIIRRVPRSAESQSVASFVSEVSF